MDVLGRITAQIRDLFVSMTPGARMTAGLLLAVIVVSITMLFRGGSPGPDEFLFGAKVLSGAEISAIEGALGQAGLNTFESVGNRIRVPYAQRAAYLAAIADADAIPGDIQGMFQRSLEQSGPFDPKSKISAHTKAVREQQLGKIVSKMGGIRDAVVIWHEENPRGLNRKREVTASVNVWPAAGDLLEPMQSKRIQRLVGSAIGADSKDVTVTNMLGGESGFGDFAPGMLDDPYYKRKFVFESNVRAKILNVLQQHIPGVSVEVMATLDPVAKKQTKDNKIGDKQAPTRTSFREEESTQSGPGSGGAPGTQLNTSIANNQPTAAPAAQSGKASRVKVSEEDSENAVSFVETISEEMGLIPTEVRAAISIPSSHWVKVWKERNPPAAGSQPVEPTADQITQLSAELSNKIQNQIALLLGRVQEGDNPFPNVQVLTYQSLPVVKPELPSFADTALAWTGDNWTSLGMFGLAIFSLIMLKSMVSSVPESQPSPTFNIADEGGGIAGEEDEEDDDGRPKLRLNVGPSLKDDLSEMVRQDPDSAAAILRAWIANAG